MDTPEAPLLGELAGASPTERLDGRRTARRSISLPVIEVINFHSTPFYHTFPLATRLNGQKTAKMGKKVEKMRSNHSAAAPQSHKTLGKKTPESPKIPLQLGCSVTQIRHFFKRTFFNLPLIFENNVKKATVWLHERGKNLSVIASQCHLPYRGEALAYRKASPLRQRLPYQGSCRTK